MNAVRTLSTLPSFLKEKFMFLYKCYCINKLAQLFLEVVIQNVLIENGY